MARNLIVCLSVCDCIQGLFALTVGFVPSGGWLCAFESFLSLFSASSSCLWTAAIALYLFTIVSDQLELEADEGSLAPRLSPYCLASMEASHSKLLKGIYLVCWGYPLVLSLILLCIQGRELGLDEEDGRQCSIRHSLVEWRLVIVTLPLLLCWMITAVLCTKTYSLLKQWEALPIRIPVRPPLRLPFFASGKALFHRIIGLPVIFLLLRVWGACYTLVDMVNEERPSWTWLYHPAALGDASQGLCNCVLFLVTAHDLKTRYLLWRRSRSESEVDESMKVEAVMDQGLDPALFATMRRIDTTGKVTIPGMPSGHSAGGDFSYYGSSAYSFLPSVASSSSFVPGTYTNAIRALNNGQGSLAIGVGGGEASSSYSGIGMFSPSPVSNDGDGIPEEMAREEDRKVDAKSKNKKENAKAHAKSGVVHSSRVPAQVSVDSPASSSSTSSPHLHSSPSPSSPSAASASAASFASSSSSSSASPALTGSASNFKKGKRKKNKIGFSTPLLSSANNTRIQRYDSADSFDDIDHEEFLLL